MRTRDKLLKGLGIGLAVLVLVVLAVRAWVVPAVIVGQIEAKVGGKVEIRSWWLNGQSAGVIGLKVHDGPGTAAPVWATAERVTTDLTLGRVLRGRFAPRKITLNAPEVALRFDEKGRLRTKVGGKSAASSKGTGPMPVVIAEAAKLTLQQEGRPAMVVTGVTARLGPDADRLILSARSNDPNWGPVEAHGEIDQAFQTGTVDLETKAPVLASPEKVKAIPFVPAEVWKQVAPDGDVDARLKVVLDPGAVHVHTEIGFRGTTVRSETLDLTARGTTGRVLVDDAIVTFKDVTGQAIAGTVKGNGTADFRQANARFDIGLDLTHLNVVDTPKSWQLDEIGVTGFLTGKVQIVAQIGPVGVDLTGTSGEAVIDNGTFEGFAVKNWKLSVSATGNDLKYDSSKGKTGRLDRPVRPLAVSIPPGASPLSSFPPFGGGIEGGSSPDPRQAQRTPSNSPLVRGRVLLEALSGLALIAVQAPDAKTDDKPKEDEPKKPAIRLPKTITTHLEMDDVELSQLIAKAQFLLGFPFPIPISGRLSLNADATIPLGNMKSIRDYAFHGDLKLIKTSAYKVDLGRVSARIDLADGVLELKDLRGQLVDHPDGGPDNPTGAVVADVPASGPLPSGAFRGTLRAAFSPPGKLTARFEGNLLPLGELGAPALPRPTPLSGLASMNLQAEADLGAASDPAAWDVSGTLDSKQITYRGAELDSVAVRFGLKNGRLDVSELTALLRQRPLRARLGLDLKSPRAFQGVVDIAGWDLAEILAWVPAAPKPAPVAGTLSARAEASGTLNPFVIKTDGHGSFERFQAGPVALGAVPFQWTTKNDIIALAITESHPFGGKLSAEADLPMTPGTPIKGRASFEAVDTAALSAAIPGGSLKLTGRAGGKVTFTVPSDVSALDANVQLSAPDLTVQGVPAEQVKASVRAQKGALGYEVSADSLGGVIKLKGAFPLTAAPAARRADGELRAVGFTLERVWKALGLSGAVTRVSGRGAIDTNLRAILAGQAAGLYAHGFAELRDLKWGSSAPLGWLHGIMLMTPTGWRIDPIDGDLLGGVATGSLWGSSPEPPEVKANPLDNAPPRQRVGFSLRLDRLELSDAVAFLPTIHGLSVRGFGTLRLAGTLGDTLHANGDLHVTGAQVAGFPLTELRVPAVFSTTGGYGSGALHVRRYTARIAGGRVHGDALIHVGTDRGFQADMVLTDVDLESITRLETEAKRPASGKISGRVALHGHDVALTRSYRGSVNLTLDDASLVALPIFRELDRFLGSARGGLFEQGDLTGTIANRELVIESATLQGRLAQLHVTGTVGFDTQLNLEVLVNMNQIIPETGAALVSALPGLRSGRNPQASLEVSNYLSNKLLKLRVTGTLKSPSVNIDPGVAVGGSAVGFFTGVLKLPLGLVK